THPSADAVYRSLVEELPTLSRTTVFSTLDLFARRGIAQRLAISGADVRYDADTSAHAHFFCRRCARVSDLPAIGAPPMPDAPEGYAFESSQFFVEGLCPSCNTAKA
ncbi:MAG: transcriptional repressor, partial [Spirochaetes bacterium]|nr:transcriptional repressor [Spirochaetota bacterium]